MADYHPLIARAVASLDKNTGENRRALYERARTALVAQLRGVVPPLDESEITRERLALEEAIRKVEAESARHARETARPAFIKRATEAPRREESAATRRGATEPSATSSVAGEMPAPPVAPSPRHESAAGCGDAARSGFAPHAQPAPPTASSCGLAVPSDAAPAARPSGGRRSLSDEAMKGFRDVVSDPKAAHASGAPRPWARDRPAARAVAAAARRSIRCRSTASSSRRCSRRTSGRCRSMGRAAEAPSGYDQFEPPQRRRAADQPVQRPRAAPRSYGRLIRLALVVFLVLAVAAAAYWQRDAIGGAASSIAALVRSPSAPQREATTPPAPRSPTASASRRRSPRPGRRWRSASCFTKRIPTIRRASVSSAPWSGAPRRAPRAPGRPPELAVRADIDVPDRKMTMTWSLRRNTDQSLPASHTIEIMFNIAAESPSGGVQNVPGVLMKQAEQTRGVPLAGLAVKVTPGFFLIGLSALETDMQRNLQLLKDRSWFDIPIVYNNNRRAILAMEKGTPGERAFADAFAAWRQ